MIYSSLGEKTKAKEFLSGALGINPYFHPIFAETAAENLARMERETDHVFPDDSKKAIDEAIRRGNAYAEAGGDCIFYLFLHSAEIIGRLAKEVKAPISILAGPQSPSVSELQDLGVARVSYGSGFLKAAISGAKQLAQEILDKGTCGLLKTGVQTPEIGALLARRKQGIS